MAVSHAEPVLLVGETGTGKTSAVQRLALMAGRRLRVLNLNQQTDSVDLLGGFKPVDSRALVNPLREKFESLFERTFRLEKNRQFLGHIQVHLTFFYKSNGFSFFKFFVHISFIKHFMPYSLYVMLCYVLHARLAFSSVTPITLRQDLLTYRLY